MTIPRGALRAWLGTAVVAGGYFGGASLGLSLAFANRNVTSVWPPTGIAVAALLVFGMRVWPGIALGALLANVANGLPWTTAAGLAIGNTLAPVVAVHLLHRVVRFRISLERVVDVLGLILAGAAAMVVSATLGTTALRLAGDVGAGEFGSVWLVWWVGDSMGVVLFAPLLLTLATDGLSLVRRPVEAFLLTTTTAAVAYLLFGLRYPLTYLAFAFVVWAALRFQQIGAALVATICAGVATWHTIHGRGEFTSLAVTGNLLTLQSFNAAVSATSLVLAAVIGERHRARRALEAAADELETRVVERTKELGAAQAIAHIGSWYWDIAKDEVTWSDELYRIYGYEPGSFKPDYAAYLALLPEEDRGRTREIVAKAMTTGESFEFRHRIVRPSGEERWMDARGDAVRGESGEVVALLGTGQDVTELRQADRLKDEFLATVSHELRTPLATIVGLTDVLDTTWDKQDETRRLDVVQRIAQSANDMRNMIEQLLDYSRLQAGRVQLRPKTLKLLDAITETVSKHEQVVQGHEVEIAVPPDLHVEADAQGLERVLGNLLSNGAKFSPAGTPLRVAARVQNGEVEVSVRDWGTGIPEDEQPQIFERFYQGSGSRSTQQGSGVGLAVAARYVELLGGRIWVRSAPGEGSTFYFTLPPVTLG